MIGVFGAVYDEQDKIGGVNRVIDLRLNSRLESVRGVFEAGRIDQEVAVVDRSSYAVARGASLACNDSLMFAREAIK